MQIFPLFYCFIAWKGYLYANKGLYKDIHSHFSLCVFPFLTLTWHILLKQTCPCLFLLCIFCLFLHLAHLPLIMFDTFETESLGFFWRHKLTLLYYYLFLSIIPIFPINLILALAFKSLWLQPIYVFRKTLAGLYWINTITVFIHL